MAKDASVVVSGVTYVPITQEEYLRMQASLAESRKARFEGLEEARVWVKAHKGVDTLEEGLRLCTPQELFALAQQQQQFTLVTNVLYRGYEQLESRGRRAAAERATAVVTPIMPGGCSQ